jgi:ABC-2 type transport system ATP-binding protein
MIHVRKLRKYYGQLPAVDGIDFDVEAGTVVGFLGPNGAGKTTTLRILTGYMPPTAGSATVNGFDVFASSCTTSGGSTGWTGHPATAGSPS